MTNKQENNLNVEAGFQSGLRDLANPGVDLFTATNGSVKRLSHLRRYSSFRALWPENVAEHTFYCAFNTWLIASDLNMRSSDPDDHVDVGYALELAVLHDIEESLTGDIITIFKNSHPDLKQTAKKMGKQCAKVLCDTELGGLATAAFARWNAQDFDSLEARVVRFADILCVVQYAREEVLGGNPAFEPVIRDIHRDLQRLRHDSTFGRYVRQFYPNDWADEVLRTVQSVNAADKYPKWENPANSIGGPNE